MYVCRKILVSVVIKSSFMPVFVEEEKVTDFIKSNHMYVYVEEANW